MKDHLKDAEEGASAALMQSARITMTVGIRTNCMTVFVTKDTKEMEECAFVVSRIHFHVLHHIN